VTGTRIGSVRRSAAAVLVAAIGLAAGTAGCGPHGIVPRMLASPPPVNGPAWNSYARDAQHDAQVALATQPLTRIHWRTPVDLDPQKVGGELLIHYGSPIITSANTVIVPVKTGATSGFRVEAHAGYNGALIWQATTDYILPAHNWTPSFSPTLTARNRLYFAGAGGKIYYRDDPDSATGTVKTLVFYGLSNYNANPATYDSTVWIDTPITADAAGDVFFGFTVLGTDPVGLQGGLARIGADGRGSWVAATTAAGDATITQVAMQCSPAISADQSTVYVAVAGASDFSAGYLLALDSTTFVTKGKVSLLDPASGQQAIVPADGSASPMVGPDGDVYYGVLEGPFGSHNDRGWLLHFDSTLATLKTPGSFGWDDTASVVPATSVPSYIGTSSYLVMTKYNNYLGNGSGNGHNEIAVLDPNATEPDPINGSTLVMNEVLTHLGVTPDGPGGAVKEWCINSAAVDPQVKSIYANSEDGYLYRWDLTTNSFPERIKLTGGIGEAYTPTVIGPDGQIYAINDATLYALGQ
jgi:hypothetical protein